MRFLDQSGLGNYIEHLGAQARLIALRWEAGLLVLALAGWLVMPRTRPSFGLLTAALALVSRKTE